MLKKDTDTYIRFRFLLYLKNVGRGFLGAAFYLLFLFVCFCDLASADGIHGNLEFNYNNTDSTTEGVAGDTTRIATDSFKQKYHLRMDKTIYPNLRLDAGTLFEKTLTSTEINGDETDVTDTRLNPFVSLQLDTPLYTAGARYDWREDKQKVSGSPSVSVINEDFKTILGWRPEGFPSMDMRYEKTKRYDQGRSFLDTTEDFYSLNLIYDSIEGLYIRYKPRYTERNDNVNDLEEQTFINEGEARYSNNFFDDRLSLYTNYNIVQTEYKTFSQGTTGESNVQLFPTSGLTSINDTPTEGALDPNPALIDGNLTASSGIDIGLPSLGEDNRPRNMGLDFINQTEINTLFVWVDRELPNAIAGSFLWEIYVSDDNVDWTLLQTLSSAPFGTFQNRFELQFSNVTTRFIKVVTRPLMASVPGASDFPDIFVTELQAFVRRAVASGGEKFTSTFQRYELGGKVKILDSPSLYYDTYLFHSKSDPSGEKRFSLSNGFSASHRFNQVFSGRARVLREDSEEQEVGTVSYRYDASVTATPLTTLSTTFSYSGAMDEIDDEGSENRNSFYLGGTAELYKGISVNFSGGLSYNQLATGEKNETTRLNLGATIVPNSKLTMNVNVSDQKKKNSGGDEPDTTTSTKRGDLQLSYYPFRTLFLSARIEVIQDELRTRTTQDYGFNWSPFPDGDLQFFFQYSESLRPEDDQQSRIFGPSMRWRISRYFILDMAYSIITSEDRTQNTDLKIFSTNLRVTF